MKTNCRPDDSTHPLQISLSGSRSLRCQGFPSIYGPPQEALLGPPVGLLIPTDVDMCWTPY
ncbi:hypothetical protein DPMN_030463 [Dreissena polymorpha]|uniref:Uncharacterized protein n=1 Tax=Dreissena polymorpha TaxID=45954 RepID=A0A9D4LY77_DREPO|nr:hypothetical protein DPMN_030463 [Dreissena polymorpha]